MEYRKRGRIAESKLITSDVRPKPWIRFIVPMTPPGVNNYVRHTRAGGHYKTAKANAFTDAVILFARPFGAVSGKTHGVQIDVYLGKGERGDSDNFPKLVLDALKKAGTFASDDSVEDLRVLKDRTERDNPRIDVLVWDRVACPALDSEEVRAAVLWL